MKILYAAFRHDPRDPDASSGADYNYYSAFLRHGAQVEVVGPFSREGTLAERAIRRAYRVMTGKRYAKFMLSSVVEASRALNRAERALRPDLVFSIFPCSFVFYRGSAPGVYRVDTTFLGWQAAYPVFGRLAMSLQVWEEKRAYARCARVITMSSWSKGILTERYGLPDSAVAVMANPSALPASVTPTTAEFVPKGIGEPLRLLLVGRDYDRKGIPIAIEVARQLRRQGISTELTICGLTGQSDDLIRYVGPFRKSLPSELAEYAALYRRAHLLIHPARFDPSPIVPAEAASFGVPTISNDVGGIGTSVTHNETGLVLPGRSPAASYVEAVLRLLRNPDDYTRLSIGARRRYEREQNWDVAGKRVMQLLQEVVDSHRN